MSDDTHVEWREWGEEPFAIADRTGSPVLLSLTATWCTECEEMDATTYSEPRIAANVNDGVVPVRVDVDRHPRVRDRYSMGGLPTTAFLTPDGEVLTGAGYLGPDAIRQALDRVRKRWDAKGAAGGDVPRRLQDNPTPSGELPAELEAAMVERLRAAYDERAGGWGQGAKYPMPRTVEFALKRDRDMALRTLNAISANLLDDYGGGFFRHATEADWSNPRYEKVLDTNAALVRTFANAYLLTGREEYREPAHRTIEYLTTTLWVEDVPGVADVPGAFAASQAPGAGAAYYTQAASDRDDDHAPAVDRTILADWNALAVDALLRYHAYTDDERARRYGCHALRTLLDGFLVDGRAVHYRAQEDGASSTAGDVGDEHAVGKPAQSDSEPERGETGLLVDHARLVRACCTARQVLGPDEVAADLVGTAEQLADYALSELRPDGASFVDGPAAGPALLDRPFRPLEGNVELADALLDLAELTGDERYRTAARDALAAFAGATDRFGPDAATYASVAARVLDGTMRIELTASAGSDLHRAALRIADHEAVVVPAVDAGDVRQGDDERPTADHTSGTADAADGVAYVVLDGERSAPATDPQALSETVSRGLSNTD